MKKYKVYIYGAGNEYNKFTSYLPFLLNSIEVMGIVTTNRQPFTHMDGYPCLTLDEVESNKIDYVIIAIHEWKEVAINLNKKGIGDRQIIRSSVFSFPWFDLEEYIKLKSSDVTILSNYCLGGVLYKELGLKALSPTVDMFCAGKDYLKFLENYKFYLSIEMVEYHCEEYVDGTFGYESFLPKGSLEGVIWKFNHDTYIKKAIKRWNEKRKQVNFNNIAALMTIQSDEDAYAFEEIAIEKKLGIYYKDLGLKDIIYIPEWENKEIRHRYNWSWANMANDYMTNFRGHVSCVDWIRFLNGQKNYRRFRCG